MKEGWKKEEDGRRRKLIQFREKNREKEKEKAREGKVRMLSNRLKKIKKYASYSIQ